MVDMVTKLNIPDILPIFPFLHWNDLKTPHGFQPWWFYHFQGSQWNIFNFLRSSCNNLIRWEKDLSPFGVNTSAPVHCWTQLASTFKIHIRDRLEFYAMDWNFPRFHTHYVINRKTPLPIQVSSPTKSQADAIQSCNRYWFMERLIWWAIIKSIWSYGMYEGKNSIVIQRSQKKFTSNYRITMT